MKLVFLVFYIHSWCINLSTSLHPPLNETQIENHKFKVSKYIYYADVETSKEISSTTDYNSKTVSFDKNRTPLRDICNATSVNDSSSERKRRSIHYFNDAVTVTVSDTVDFSGLSHVFRNCIHITVEPECYRMLPNRSVYVPLYRRLFDKSNYVIRNGLLFICSDILDLLEEKFHSGDIISLVGISISTACIILHMIMFFVVEKMRNLPGYCLFSLCISLMIVYIDNFVQMNIHDQADCNAIGMIMMYGLLSSFFWMNVISFDVWYTIRQAVVKLRLATNRSMLLRFSMYSIYAWGMPLLIIIIAIIADYVSEDQKYKLIFRMMTCWFQHKTPLLLYFALPVFILFLMNAILFVISFVIITRTRADSGSQDAYNLRSRLFMSLRLSSVMGLMWIFGLIASATQREWLSYLHSVCTASQGVFIFFSFTINEKTKMACKRALANKKISVISQQTLFSK